MKAAPKAKVKAAPKPKVKAVAKGKATPKAKATGMKAKGRRASGQLRCCRILKQHFVEKSF